MANHKATKKSARQDLIRRARNRGVRTQMRSTVKALRGAIESGDKDAIPSRMKDVERAIRKAASKGVVPARQANRKVSRLARAAHAALS